MGVAVTPPRYEPRRPAKPQGIGSTRKQAASARRGVTGVCHTPVEFSVPLLWVGPDGTLTSIHISGIPCIDRENAVNWSGGSLIATIAVGALTIGAAPSMAASADIGWVYTADDPSGGRAYFDADYAGHPSNESLIVCDQRADTYGAIAYLASGTEPNAQGDPPVTLFHKDPGTFDGCHALVGDFFPEDTPVQLRVCLYQYPEYEYSCSAWIPGRA